MEGTRIIEEERKWKNYLARDTEFYYSPGFPREIVMPPAGGNK